MRTEKLITSASLPTREGRRNVGDVVSDLIVGARLGKSLNDVGDGASWIEGEIDGEWVELRVTIRPRPAAENS